MSIKDLDRQMPEAAACTCFNTLKNAMDPCGTVQMSILGSAALFSTHADILDVDLYADQEPSCAFNLYFTLPSLFLSLYHHEHVANFLQTCTMRKRKIFSVAQQAIASPSARDILVS